MLFANCSWALRFSSLLFMDASNAIRGLFVDCSWVVRGLFVGCSRAVHKLVLETWQKLRVQSVACSWGVRKLFASCSRAIRGCSGTVRRTSWAWARPWDQMKQSRWNETIGSNVLGNNICDNRRWNKTCRTKICET